LRAGTVTREALFQRYNSRDYPHKVLIRRSADQEESDRMSAAAAVSTADFDKEVLQSDIPVLVDFWAVWCGPCRHIAPIVDSVAEEFAGKAKVFKLNVDDNQDIAARYGVMTIPTLIIFKDGQRVGDLHGRQNSKQAIGDALREHIA
jgi:thioredoxin 1